MTLRIAKLAGEYDAVAAWRGIDAETVRQEVEEYHAEGRDFWIALDGERVVGALAPWHAPDGRHRLFYDRTRADAYGRLIEVIEGPCYATFDVADTEAIETHLACGFGEHRRENTYEIPVIARDAPVPDGLRIISAGDTALEPLMLLDCALREDIPGSDGWQPDPVWFREETYDSQFFDPRSYRVALDGDDYVGLCRIWREVPPDPRRRLGAVGVLPPYRGRGLGRALIAAAMAPIVGEVAYVNAEADVTNAASHALMTSFGARITGGSVELFRP